MEGFSPVEIPTTTESSFSIAGADCQVLTMSLKPGQRFITEPGSLMFMEPSLKSTVECGNCSRMCVGETCCKSVYHNSGSKDSYVAVTPSYPAKIIPVDLSTVGKKIIAKSGAFISSVGDVSLSAEFDCCPTTCFYGGMGFARQGNSTCVLF